MRSEKEKRVEVNLAMLYVASSMKQLIDAVSQLQKVLGEYK